MKTDLENDGNFKMSGLEKAAEARRFDRLAENANSWELRKYYSEKAKQVRKAAEVEPYRAAVKALTNRYVAELKRTGLAFSDVDVEIKA